MNHQLMLASASPRRWSLLRLTGLSAELFRADIEEILQEAEGAQSFARRLALEKARKAAANSGAQGLIVAADTIVVDGDRVLGKPIDEQQAGQMLLNLRGRKHMVITAIAILDSESGREFVDHCETAVPMRNVSRKEIQAYIETGDAMDKAGAYAIQHADFRPVEVNNMNGCYANVMGLPLCHLTRILREFSVSPTNDIVKQCMEHTNYNCHVYPTILNSSL